MLCYSSAVRSAQTRCYHSTQLDCIIRPLSQLQLLPQHNALSCVHCSAFSAICTCSGTGLPDWTLKLLHAHRIDEANMALSAAIASTNTMLRPLSRSHPAKHQHTLRIAIVNMHSICAVGRNCASPLYIAAPAHHLFAESSLCPKLFPQSP